MISRAFLALITRDMQLVFRHTSDAVNPVLFFVIATSLFPLGLSPQPELLRSIAPGILWVNALLATLLALDSLFRTDFDDGTLEQILLSPVPTPILVLAKITAHWLVTGGYR